MLFLLTKAPNIFISLTFWIILHSQDGGNVTKTRGSFLVFPAWEVQKRFNAPVLGQKVALKVSKSRAIPPYVPGVNPPGWPLIIALELHYPVIQFLIGTFITCLAPRAGKINQVACCDWLPEIEPSCPLGTTHCILQEKFPRKPYNKSFIKNTIVFTLGEVDTLKEQVNEKSKKHAKQTWNYCTKRSLSWS